jgi:hypothetical protein
LGLQVALYFATASLWVCLSQLLAALATVHRCMENAFRASDVFVAGSGLSHPSCRLLSLPLSVSRLVSSNLADRLFNKRWHGQRFAKTRYHEDADAMSCANGTAACGSRSCFCDVAHSLKTKVHGDSTGDGECVHVSGKSSRRGPNTMIRK